MIMTFRGPWLAHASHEGIACAEFIAGKSSPSEKMASSCVYSNPQVASIGNRVKQKARYEYK